MCFNKTNFLLLFLLPVFVSCSGLQSYYSKIETFMTKEKYESAQALTFDSKKVYGTKNELLYYLDLGLLEHLSKNYEKSNVAFEQAKQIYSQNYTKSISAGTVSLFSNDNVIPYYGNAYEMAYTNIFCALNYILQNQNNEAVVEARQVDNLFKKINADTYGKDFYKDDPFIRYFMGIVYENAGYYNDALISYKLALKNYASYNSTNKNYEKGNNNIYDLKAPADLLYSLYDLTLKLGMKQEAEQLRQEYNIALKQKYENCGELIIINYNGLSPKKIDNIIEMSVYNAWPYFNSSQARNEDLAKVEQVNSAIRAGLSDAYIKIAFPKYVRFNNEIDSFCLEEIDFQNKKTTKVEGSDSTEVSDIGTLLIKDLERQNAAVYSKTIARALGRYVLARVAVNQVRQQENNKDHTLSILANSILNIANSVLEKADKRSWRTLPETINMVRLYIPEGTHKLNINFLNSSNNVVSTQQITADIIKNRKTFIIVNSFKSNK